MVQKRLTDTKRNPSPTRRSVSRTQNSSSLPAATHARHAAVSSNTASAFRSSKRSASLQDSKNYVPKTARANNHSSGVRSASSTSAHAQKSPQFSAILRILLVVIIVLFCWGIFDYASNVNKAYSGVHIGAVDVGGLTADEIEQKVSDYYGPILSSSSVNVYRSAEAQVAVENGAALDSGDEDMSLDEQREQRLGWNVNAETVEASLDTAHAAAAAIGYAKDLGSLIDRLNAQFFGYTIDPELSFGTSYSNLVGEINDTIGTPRTDFNVEVDSGVASVTEGMSGYLINDETFQSSLTKALLNQSAETQSVIAVAEEAPVHITRDQAQSVADKINNAIANGLNFVYKDYGFNITASTLGDWVATEISETDNGWVLTPYLDSSTARSALQQNVRNVAGDEVVDVSFSVDGRSVTVIPKSQGTMPAVDPAVTAANQALFSGDTADTSTIQIQADDIPSSVSFDDALDMGLVTEVSLFTTTYTYGTERTENRNFNIHRAADLLTCSVCPAGGSWSFHQTAGECNEENGFKDAGIIQDGVYTSSYGGGICQVATTVFNAVYEAGYYVDTRYNHTLYNSAYPAGRDAAVNWPDLDLVWSNNTDSDVLLITWYTEGSLTVALYSVDPQYTVSTYTSDWTEGEEYDTYYIYDDTLSPKGYYVKTQGDNGRSIYVDRTVTDKNGVQVSYQRFTSNYDPTDEILYVGTEYEIPEDKKDNIMEDTD